MSKRRARQLQGVLQGLGMGAGIMYLLDPHLGRRRRSADVGDRAKAAIGDGAAGVVRAVREAGNRLYGVGAELRGLLGDEELSSRQLAARVRARLGRIASQPGAIAVSAQGRQVTLSGDVLARELTEVLEGVASVRGVRGVMNRLVAHTHPGDIPGGQESAPVVEPADWAPATRIGAGVLGGVLLVRGLRRRTVGALALGGLGFGLLARAAAPAVGRRVALPGATGIDIERTIAIDAPVESVYAQWAAYETFPYVMRNVREVRDLGSGRSLWTVRGPLDATIRFHARVTEQRPHEVFAWQTEPDETVTHAGRAHFAPLPDGRTRVHVRLTYHPPAGPAGHLVATLFGADPGRELAEDLLRLKTFLETGRPARDAARRVGP